MFIYGPVLALRSGRLSFFSATNPGLYISGFGHESKFQTIEKIPSAYRPKSIFVPAGENWENVEEKRCAAQINFPLIAKPDVGFRGLLVRKIATPKDLRNYLQKYPFDFIVQEFLIEPTEIGVLYYRFPGEEKGEISSLTLKEFLHVIGDGRSTVEELILAHPRALLQIERLHQYQADLLTATPKAGQKIPLGVIGNHSKGTAFINGNDLIDDDLRETFDRLTKQIEGFYYGRFDIKCESLDSLKAGRNFKIIEINGMCSEPTHIYDPGRMSYFGALLDIMKHWSIIRQISLANHRLGVPYIRPMYIIRKFRELFAYQKKIAELSQS